MTASNMDYLPKSGAWGERCTPEPSKCCGIRIGVHRPEVREARPRTTFYHHDAIEPG